MNSTINYSILFYGSYGGFIIILAFWFIFCYQYIKKNIKHKNTILKLKYISSITLFIIFTLVFIFGLYDAQGMEEIGVVIIYGILLLIVISNFIILSVMASRIENKLKQNNS